VVITALDRSRTNALGLAVIPFSFVPFEMMEAKVEFSLLSGHE
jgi:hypothetical protein